MIARYACSFTSMIVLLLLASAPSTQAQGLDLYMAASSEVTSPGDRVTYSVTATNTGPADLLDVTVEIALPDHISSFQARDVPDVSCGSGICGADRVATWSVGTLAPGESRSVFYHPEITDSAPETTIMSNATASASNATEASASLDVRIDPTPLLRLSVAPAPGPAVPGEPFTYTLTFGNIGSSSPSDVVLTMPVPEGSSFISASDAGTETGGLVTWDLGLLPSAGSGKVRLTVEVDETLESGEVLEATAALDPGVASEYVAQSSAVTPVRAGSPLGLSYAVDQTTAGAGDALTYSVTATNTGPADLLDVTARILLPGSITSFQARDVPDVSCGSGICGADKVATWSIDTLAPGESRSVTFRTFVDDEAIPGEVLRSMLTASSGDSQVKAAQDVQVDPTPLLRLSVAPEPGPAVPGEPFTYTLTFGNIGSSSPSDVVLTMPVPEGSSFISATEAGTETDGLVTWEIPLFAAAKGAQVSLTVMPDLGLPEGFLLKALAALDPTTTNEVVVHSSAVTPVRAGSPLGLSYAVDQTTAGAGDALTYSVTATNTGPADLLDVTARILLPGSITSFQARDVPDVSCGSGICGADKVATWTVGTLSPRQSRTVTFHTSVAEDVTLGSILRSFVSATASNANSQVLAQANVLAGALLDFVPPAVPVGLAATFGDGEVTLTWTANAEGDLDSYRLYRDTAPGATTLLAEIGAGATSYVDDVTEAGATYFYRLTAVDQAGNESFFSNEVTVDVVSTAFETDQGLPATFALAEAYPNPFNPQTTIRYALPQAVHVRLVVYDLLGRPVAVLVDREQAAGRYDVVLKAAGLPSGVYLYSLQTDAFNLTRRVVLLK